MRYLCLGYYAPEIYESMSEEERKALGERCRPHDEKFFGTGRVLDVVSLEHPHGAHIRPGPNGQTVTDGPFAEAKEVVGSYFLIEADDLDHAVEIARLHPAAQIGWEVGFSMEVRPVDTVWVKNGEYVGPKRES
jgi:hypothetical protein